MSKRYERQAESSTIVELLCVVRAKWHPHLADVAIDVLTVCEYDEESGEELPCLKHHGYPAAATIKVMSHERRAQGAGDALLTIDAIAWHALAYLARVALLDHELTHVELVKKDGAVALDDLRRPKLKLRLHDIKIEGFESVMARHREHALETMAVRRCRHDSGQYFWDFDGVAPAEAATASSPNIRVNEQGTYVSFDENAVGLIAAAASALGIRSLT
jgi:hypothetical protein